MRLVGRILENELLYHYVSAAVVALWLFQAFDNEGWIRGLYLWVAVSVAFTSIKSMRR